jgi:integrase
MKLLNVAGCKNLKRCPVTGMYYWRQYASGRQFFKATGESKSESKAKRIGQRMFAEWLGDPHKIRSAAFLFEHVAAMYLKLKEDRRPKTKVSANLHTNKHLMPYFQGWPIDRVEGQWPAYVKFKRLTAPDRRFYNDCKHLSGILLLAYRKGMVSKPPSLQNPDEKVDAGKEYTDAEITALLKHAGPDLSLQILMAVLMGMRRSEILLLSWDRVDLDKGIIHLRAEDTKTKDPRQVPIHGDVLKILTARRAASKSPYVFPWWEDPTRPATDNKSAWTTCRRKAGVTGRFHDLRHTAVTRMLFRYNIPPAKVGAIVGMSLAVMDRYSHPKGEHLIETINSIRGNFDQKQKSGKNTYGNK